MRLLRRRLRNFINPGVIIGTLPNNIVNGAADDAVPVMANFNWILAQVNANAASASSVATIQGLINSWGPLTNFTPAITFGGAAVGVTYNVGATKGIWTQVAGVFFMWFQVLLTNKGSSVGVAALTNMPAISNTAFNGNLPCGICTASQVTFADKYLVLTPFATTNSLAIASVPGGGGGGPNFLDNTNFINTSAVFGFACYPQ